MSLRENWSRCKYQTRKTEVLNYYQILQWYVAKKKGFYNGKHKRFNKDYKTHRDLSKSRSWL